ncbi:MAG: RNA polymerase sigma factor [Terriglobia bacterium]
MKTKNGIMPPDDIESTSEHQLIVAAQLGNETAFAALFDRQKRQVYSLCLRVARNSSRAEDLTQQIFLKVFRNIASFPGESGFSNWVHRITVNENLMYLRKQRLQRIAPQQRIDGAYGVKSQTQMKKAPEF